MKLSGNAVRFILYVGAIVCAILLLLQGVKLDSEWLRAVNLTVGAVVGLVWVFDRYVWRWAVVRKIFPRRLVRGTWQGELVSDWVDPKTRKGLSPISVYLVIDQTYSEVTASLLTSESKSRSMIATLDDPARGQCLLSAIYMNTPELLRQDESRIHRGGLVLEVAGSPPNRLEGSYWTDRGTRGQMTFDSYSHQLFEVYEDARTASYS